MKRAALLLLWTLHSPGIAAIPFLEQSHQERGRLLSILQNQVAGEGVSEQAIARARLLVVTVFAHADMAILRRLGGINKVKILISPGKVTDVAEFADLKGVKTHVNTLYDDAGGIADSAYGRPGGVMVVVEPDLHNNGDSFIHELGHLTHLAGSIPGGRWRQRISQLYKAAMARPQKSGITDYADTNEVEFFGEATEFYFKGDAGRSRLSGELFELLHEIYGDPIR